MIKKLRRKLLAVSMLSLFLVLFVIVGAVNVFNFSKIANDADSTLYLLSQNNGNLPPPENRFPEQFDGGMFEDRAPHHSPEFNFQTRFFTVIFGKNENILSYNMEHIAAVDVNKAANMALSALRSGREKGYFGNYRFSVTEQNSGEGYIVIFLDCAKELETFNNFLAISCLMSLLGLAAVFVLIFVLSGRIVRPISESYEKQKQFITDAGHEIKTPITIIDADAEVLEMEIGDNEWLIDIKNQTKRLASLTNDLIYLSRMQEDGLSLKMIDFPASDVVLETAQSFQSRALTGHKDLLWEIQPMLSLCGDEKAIRQLVSILLDNAIKYSPQNTAISLNFGKNGRNLVLSVSNVSQNEIVGNPSKLFDRFYRTDSSHNSQTGGYGIGLSIAKAVVDAHKGKIYATCPDGKLITIAAVFPL